MQPYEAWSDYRRTGYPQTLIEPEVEYYVTTEYSVEDEDDLATRVDTFIFSPIVDLDGPPARVKYLLNEANINEASLNDAISNMGGDAMDTPMWWME
jgi:hypothetical protein